MFCCETHGHSNRCLRSSNIVISIFCSRCIFHSHSSKSRCQHHPSRLKSGRIGTETQRAYGRLSSIAYCQHYIIIIIICSSIIVLSITRSCKSQEQLFIARMMVLVIIRYRDSRCRSCLSVSPAIISIGLRNPASFCSSIIRIWTRLPRVTTPAGKCGVASTSRDYHPPILSP